MLLKVETADSITPMAKTSKKGSRNIQLRTGGLHLVIQTQIRIARTMKAKPMQAKVSLLLSSILTVKESWLIL
jgi:hypothetical protein